MKRRVAVGFLLQLALVIPTGGRTAEIPFAEQFALAPEREEALRQLLPGTEDYYYYHCLHYQHLQQFEKVEPLLEAWIQRHSVTYRVTEIRNRQALLTYEQSAEPSLIHLRQALNLHFGHQRRSCNEQIQLPTELDSRQITGEAFLKRALARHRDLQGVEDAGLWTLVDRDLTQQHQRRLLSRLDRPDHPGLVALVVKDLKDGTSFGTYPIHGRLLRDQLDECRKAVPELAVNAAFVQTYLARLKPSPDENVDVDDGARQAYLERLRGFVDSLPGAFNSLKAHVLYQQLVHDRERGVHDRELLLRYLALPRNMPYVRPELLRARPRDEPRADLRASFSPQLPWSPIGDDEPLVRAYLAHFVDLPGYGDFRAWIREEYLREVYAESKLVSGLGDAERWLSWLSPAAVQRLRDRVDLEFAPTKQRRVVPEDSVRLELFIKNIPTLIIKVYKINTANFYRENRREIDTDINLDGLTPNWEQTYRYDTPPLRREKHLFDFPELTGPGVFVIDFIGSGKSSRVVVRRGALRYVSRTTVAGQVVTVLDEQNRHVPEATLELEGRTFQSNEQGDILVPFSTRPGVKAVILGQGDFHSLQSFSHEGESYRLQAGIHVDRESLLEGRQAEVLVRPSLSVGQVPVSLSVLKNVRMRVTAIDHDGVPTSFEVEDFRLHEDRDTTFPIHVPSRLVQLEFQLSGEVSPRNQSEDVRLQVKETFQVNGLDATQAIASLQLMRTDEGYFVEVRGRTGEPRAHVPVRLRLRHRHYRDPWDVTLKSDDQGRIRLGSLDGLETVEGSLWDVGNRRWPLVNQRHSYQRAIHGIAGKALEIPYPGLTDEGVRRSAFSLLETRDDQFVADHFASLSAKEGALRLQGLPAGDYDLLLREVGERIRVRIVEGAEWQGHLLGEHRLLEVRDAHPARMAEVTSDGDVVRLRIHHADAFTRVHVVATRFLPEFDLFSQLAVVRDAEPAFLQHTPLQSAYVEGRNIGDEYRYIIERKYQAKFPGNMLTRPGLLLNPWAVHETKTSRQTIAEGQDFAARGTPPSRRQERESREERAAPEWKATGSLDYLARPSVVLLNLRPDSRGVIELERTELDDRQHLHIALVHPRSTSYQQVALQDVDVAMLDRRLATALDADRHFIQKRQVRRIDVGESFTLDDVSSSRFEIYDSRAKLFALHATLVENEKLPEFQWLMRWHTFDEDAKNQLYSKYACHEVHFFLYHRDREFFERVVLPYLRHKREKQFLDQWLLGDDLHDYLRPMRYDQLNVVERILLAERLDDRAMMAREIEHELALKKPDLVRANRLFEAAIAGGALRQSELVKRFPTNLSMIMNGAAQADFDSMADLLEEASSRSGAMGDMGMGDMGMGSMGMGSMGMGGMEMGGMGMGGMGMGGMDMMGGLAGMMPGMEGTVEFDDDFSSMMPGMGNGMMMGRGGRAMRPEEIKRRLEAEAAKSLPSQPFFDDRAQDKVSPRLFRPVDQTSEWAETHYYRQRMAERSGERIRANPFWHDFARHEIGTPFVSSHFAEAASNLSESLFALALLDLPAEAAEHELHFEQGRLTLKPGSPLLILFEEIHEASAELEGAEILVNQHVYRLAERSDDRRPGEHGDEEESPFHDECLVQDVYGCQVVITNSTARRQTVELLLQIPQGAIPLSKGRATSGRQIQLEPFQTHKLDYYFYFPRTGTFPHYPVQVTRDERVVATAQPRELRVVTQLSQENRQSWEFVSQKGSDEEVLRFLREQNLRAVELDDLAWRMKDPDFFQRTLEQLKQRRIYAHTLWSYGVLHNEPSAIRTFLEMSPEFIGRCGAYLDSPLAKIDPEERRRYEHLEYRPLVNPRAHPLASRREILNDRFARQYGHLMDILSCRRQLDDRDRMAVVYYLLLQDRIEEGQKLFSSINPDRLETRMQYDYFAAFLDFFQPQPARAQAIAARYAEHPVAEWRHLFAAVLAKFEELEGAETVAVDPRDRDQVQTSLAAAGPNLELKVEARQITISHQKVEDLVVNFYEMDIELLFSRNPFVQGETGQFSWIQPHLTEILRVDRDPSRTVIPLPESLRNRNVLVEVVSQGIRRWQPYYANSLRLQVHTDYGQVRVLDESTGRPLSTVYVKVYARQRDGRVVFHKDGYTDLGGRFDYASLSTNQLDQVQRFALLILSDEQGAEVRETEPPAW